MRRDVSRRALLAGAAAAGGSVAGCLGYGAGDGDGDPGPDGDDLPDGCPTTQGLDVEWPEELASEAVATFVEAYDEAYVREVDVGFEAASRLDEYDLSGGVVGEPTERGDGYVVEVQGGGGVYHPTLHLEAAVADPPDGAGVIPHDEFDDARVRRVLEAAVESDGGRDGENDEASTLVEDGAQIDRYLDLFESLDEGFDAPEGPGDSATLYVDVDGTVVELSVDADSFHGDYWWEARYYVDERVLRRATDPDAAPRDGELLECRTAG